MPDHIAFVREAVHLAQQNRALGTQPFGDVPTRDGQRIATGIHQIAHTCNPNHHTEMQALRAASAVPGQPCLDGCVVCAALGMALEITPLPLICMDTEVTAARLYGDLPARPASAG